MLILLIFDFDKDCTIRQSLFWICCFGLVLYSFILLISRLLNLAEFNDNVRDTISYCNKLNKTIKIEYLIHFIVCVLLLFSRNFLMFLSLAPLVAWHCYKYYKHHHYVDPIELYHSLKEHRKDGIISLIVLSIVLVWLIIKGTICNVNLLLYTKK
ncbi:protein cornichon [Anaeramoeba flamelloides]|uniref:Protein cornichon n=1 Tax=Anaeramoeba flamelloides TaxID=1746091 RepID=A0AAV7Z625_9EUKA|nr:protein cornichon [Anaeramoeba flamelloides]